MEERSPGTVPVAAATAVAATTIDDPPRPLPNPPPGALVIPQLQPGTYVVQVPKDQIYRIPPPENAAIAERYRTPLRPTGKSQKQSFYSRLCFGLLYLLGALIAIALLLYVCYLIINPQNPTFAVSRVIAKNATAATSSNRHHPTPHGKTLVDFEIFLKVNNPNPKMGVHYDGEGETTLLSMQKKIGTGKFKGFHQGIEKSTTVRVLVSVAHEALPKEVEKGVMKNAAVAMAVTVAVPVKMQIGAANTWRMPMHVACDFRASALTKDGSVASQQCQTNINWKP